MRFSRLIKKSYNLLEQGPPPAPEENNQDAAMPQSNPAPSPEQKQEAGNDIEKAGEKMTNQVETAMDEMVSLLGKVVDFLRNEQRIGQAKYPPKISNLLNTIKKASLTQSSTEGLGQIEDAVSEVDDFYNNKTEEPVGEGFFYKKYIKKGK
jgi:uncharacterized phage infection (PIP) family protein YhgE